MIISTIKARPVNFTVRVRDGEGDSWHAGLADAGLKANESLKGIKSLDALATGYLDTQAKHTKLTNDHAELVNRTADLEGRIPKVPEKPDGYVIPAKFGEKLADDDVKALNSFKAIAHKAGISQSGFDALIEFNRTMNAEAMARMSSQDILAKTTKSREAEEALKAEWGDKFDSNYELAERAATTLGGDELINTLEGLGLTRNPVVIKLFHTIATKIGEDNMIVADPNVKGDGTGVQHTVDGRPKLSFPSMKGKK